MSNPREVVAVLTAARNPREDFLTDLYNSLRIQDANWRWYLQIDHAQDEVSEEVRDFLDSLDKDERVFVAWNGSHLGVSATRNFALFRSHERMVMAVDADDWLEEGAIRALEEALTNEPRAAWAVGRVMRDGKLSHLADGLLPERYWFEMWEERGDAKLNDPPPTSWMLKREYLLAYGGWPALPVLEDQALIHTISHFHPGVGVPYTVLHYRKHPGQLTAREEVVRSDFYRQLSSDYLTERQEALTRIYKGEQ